MGAVGGVRVTSDESSDSLRSSLINTALDDMSVSKYESDSSPTEVFNIIEEYPDKGRGKLVPCIMMKRSNSQYLKLKAG